MTSYRPRMVDSTATLVTIAGSLVLLYVLIKSHLYVTRKLWKPVIEEEVEAMHGEDSGGVEESGGWNEESGGENDGEPDEERPPRGWDEVG